MNNFMSLEAKIMEDFLNLMNKKELKETLVFQDSPKQYLYKDAYILLHNYFVTFNDELKIKIFNIHHNILEEIFLGTKIYHEFSLKFMKVIIKKDIRNVILFNNVHRAITNNLLLDKSIKKYESKPCSKLIYQSIVCSYRATKDNVIKYIDKIWTNDYILDRILLSQILTRRSDIDSQFLYRLISKVPVYIRYDIENHPKYKGTASFILDNLNNNEDVSL